MKLSTSAGLKLAVTLTLIFPAVAKADDMLSGFVHDTLRVTGTTVKGAGNVLVGTVDAAGNVLDASGNIVGSVILPGGTTTTKTVVVGSSATPVTLLGTSNEVYGYSIATRRNDLRQAVQLAESQQKITTPQAANLRAELDQNASNEANATADKVLTFDEALSLARDLDKANTELSTLLSLQPFNRLVVVDNSGSSRILVVNRSAISPADTVIASAPVIASNPGSTQTTTEIHRSTVNGVTTSTQTTTTKVVPATEVTTDVFITTLEGRRLQLESAIAAGQAAGRISEAQARAWRAELDAIARAQAASKSGTFDYVSVLPLAMSLDYIGNVVMTSSPGIAYVPMINGQRFIVADGRIIMLDDIMVRRADLESKISRKLAAGKLTDGQARELRAELGDVARVEAGMRAHSSSFSPKEASTLYKMFDRVGSRLDEMAGKS